MRIFLAGHNGMVGKSIENLLSKNSSVELITRQKKDLDLVNQDKVKHFFENTKIDCVIIAAARVGGIYANNTYPGDFIYQNLMIQNNLIHQSYNAGISKILFLGSSCIYPKNAPQPMTEDLLLTGDLEKTNEPYAIAKIAGIKMCESYNRQFGVDYRSIMPTNLYGHGDNFDLADSHVVPALIRKFHQAKVEKLEHVTIWGDGSPMREFLHVDDMASASIYVMNIPKELYKNSTKDMLSHINIGSGEEISIKDLATMISNIVGFNGKLIFDNSKPNGTPRKLLDSSKINNLGWSPSIKLHDGLLETYKWFVDNQNSMHIRK